MSEKYLRRIDNPWNGTGKKEVRLYGDDWGTDPEPFGDSLSGTIAFYPDGRVYVYYNEAAVLAAAHGSGNRKSRVTKSTGKRTPPKIDEYFRLASFLSNEPVYRSHFGQGPLSADPNAAEIAEYMKNYEYRDYMWEMLCAAFTGNADPLRRMADAIEMVKKIQEEGEEFTPRRSWHEIFRAITYAAKKAGKPPTRQSIEKELLIINPNASKGDALVANLGRMGFGWLAQAPSRPRNPKDEKAQKRTGNRNEPQGKKSA